MKNIGIFLIALTLVVGCTSSSSSTSTVGSDKTSNPDVASSEFKVALLTPGPISDAGWNAMAYEGLKAIESDLGAKVSNEESSGTKIKDSMRSYAQEGYGLVFGHGFEYNEPGVAVSKDFPKTIFVSSSGGATSPNAGAFRFYLEQGFYLAGVMAASMSKTGTVATVGLGGIPSITSTFKAFEAGAKATNPKIKVLNIELSGDRDISAAKQATSEAIRSGADFVIHQANAAAQGVFDACKANPNVYAFGANLDQNSNASNVVIASAIINAKPAFLDLAKRVKEGKYKGEIALYGMDKGAIDFVINPKLTAVVPTPVIDKLNQISVDIKNGKLLIPMDKF